MRPFYSAEENAWPNCSELPNLLCDPENYIFHISISHTLLKLLEGSQKSLGIGHFNRSTTPTKEKGHCRPKDNKKMIWLSKGVTKIHYINFLPHQEHQLNNEWERIYRVQEVTYVWSTSYMRVTFKVDVKPKLCIVETTLKQICTLSTKITVKEIHGNYNWRNSCSSLPFYSCYWTYILNNWNGDQNCLHPLNHFLLSFWGWSKDQAHLLESKQIKCTWDRGQ